MAPRATQRAWRIALTTPFLLAAALAAQISPQNDADIERCLTEGKIGKKLETLVGVTKPELFKIECDGEEQSVIFKSLDEHRRGVTRMQRGGTEFGFSDSYKYERAAYLLDRQLGLNMVPVAVIRPIKGDEGALIPWIEDATHEADMKAKPTGPQMAALAAQKSTMRLFDALIYNVDRRPENWMLDSETWTLYLIDHSRAFRSTRDLPEGYADKRARLSMGLYENLKALDEARLSELLEDLITQKQIRALLARRDGIIEKVDNDCEEYGNAVIFSDWESAAGLSETE